MKQSTIKLPDNSEAKLFEYERAEYKEGLRRRKAEEWCWYYRLTKGLIYPRGFAIDSSPPEIHILERCFAKNTLLEHESGHLMGKKDLYFKIDVMNFTFLLRGRYG